jgi:hypothetical protein
MLQMIYIVLFVGTPLFVLITVLLIRRLGHGVKAFNEINMPLSDEESYRTIPSHFLQHLSFSVRYSSVKKRLGSGQNYVYLEEQLRYGTVPLSDWIKHDVPIDEGIQLSPQFLRKISLLKQYDSKNVAPMIPTLARAAGGMR